MVSPSSTRSSKPTSKELFAAYVAADQAIITAVASGNLTAKELSDDLAPAQFTHLVDEVSKLQAKGWVSTGSDKNRLISATLAATGRDASVKACVSGDWHFVVKKTGKPVDPSFHPRTAIVTAALVLLDGRWKFASAGIEFVPSC